MTVKLLHIGQHKCGSTFLQGNFFPLIKEINCLTFIKQNPMNSVIEELARNPDPWFSHAEVMAKLNHYIEKNNINCISSEVFCGSGMELGSCLGLSLAAERAHKTFPHAKILFVIREQRAILRSLYKDWVCYGTTLSYKNWLNRSLSNWRLNFCHYHGIAKIYGDLYGLENLKVVLFEDLFKRNTMEDILTFGGFSTEGLDLVNTKMKLNPGFSDTAVIIARILNRLIRTKNSEQVGCYSAPELRFYDLLRYRFYPKINEWLEKISLIDFEKIESAFPELHDSIARDNQILANFLGINLDDLTRAGYIC